MNLPNNPIGGVVIKQLFLLAVIILLSGVVLWHLSMFLPSLLGALTLYILCRKLNFYLLEKRKWAPWLATSSIFLLSGIVLILPLYFLVDVLISKFGNAQMYLGNFTEFLEKIHVYLKLKFNIDILDKDLMEKLQGWVAKMSGTLLSGTFNALTVVFSMYFILYFMMTNPRKFEKILTTIVPLKKANTERIGNKIMSMVVANAVGIPVVALGQAIIALIGYWILGAPNPMLLFVLTFITSMLPIVGAAIVYVPVGIYMMAMGDNNGIWLIAYCVVIVGLTDNILRFTLLKKLEDIHPLNTVFGIILGLEIFGFMGLVFGPILVSITLLLIQVYHNEFLSKPNSVLVDDEGNALSATTEDVVQND
ncbi:MULTISPECIES: AI-2E family transporter [Amniculibacterium]|jgi:predicted PurR-regulated permease PerM|uniref:AI-2E family transporter n=1 Tax=Amniculibacterium TaxID=2715289 RepID=UPI000F5A7097|nr:MULTISPECIES: AI-2E family transporter [Amniculibacterium]